MKIAHFYDYFSNGRIENLMVNILTHLKLEGEKEILCTVKRNTSYDKRLQGKQIKWNVYTEKNIRNFAIRFFLSCRAIKKYCKKVRPDILHIHIYNPIGIYYARIGRKYCKKVILHAHGTNYKHNFLKLKNIFLIMTFFIPKKTVCIACSKNAALFCFRKSKPSMILNNTVDLKNLRTGNPTYREKYHLEDKWVITSIGPLEKSQNMLLLINIFRAFKKKKENAFLLIVGAGSQKERILKKIKRIHLEKDFLLLENVSDIKNIYASSDFYISCPRFEPFGLSVIEAQACRLPTLVSASVSREEKISNFITFMNIKSIYYTVCKILETANKCEVKEYRLVNYTPMKPYIDKIEKKYLS